MKYTLEISKLIGERAFLHHRQIFEFDTEKEASDLLMITREGLPVGFAADVSYQKPGTDTTTKVKVAA